jgi:hypothetical protein
MVGGLKSVGPHFRTPPPRLYKPSSDAWPMAVAIQVLVRRRARGPLPGGLITLMPFAECPGCGALIQ